MITADNAAVYVIYWSSVHIYKFGNAITFTPSFTPGLYHEGNGKDLRSHALEFKS